MALPGEIQAHYDEGREDQRLRTGHGGLELARTRELLERVLPNPPARVLDVGGATGVHAEWLADEGYQVHLVDPVASQVATASSHGGFTTAVGDARSLDEDDESYDVVLVLGPLYHLVERADRLLALREAARVVRPDGVVAVAAISRYASLLDLIGRGVLDDAAARHMVERDIAEGQHRSAGEGLFTTAFFHHPEELGPEITEAGLVDVEVYGIEGPCYWLPDFDTRWAEPAQRDEMLWAARLVERDPSALNLSGHLLGIGRRP